MLMKNFAQGLALGDFFVIGLIIIMMIILYSVYIDRIIIKCNTIPYIPNVKVLPGSHMAPEVRSVKN